MDSVGKAIVSAQGYVNRSLSHKEPWQIVTITTTAVLTSVWLWNFISQDESKLCFLPFEVHQHIIIQDNQVTYT